MKLKPTHYDHYRRPTMTLPKAIEILKLCHDTPPSGAIPDFIDALTIGLFVMNLLERGDLHYAPLP